MSPRIFYMKLVISGLFVLLIFLTSTTHSNDANRYSWETLTFDGYVKESGTQTKLIVFIDPSDSLEQGTMSFLEVFFDEERIPIPDGIFGKYEPVHPNSFYFTAKQIGAKELPEAWIRLHFNYGASTNIQSGTVIFLNREYHSHSLQNKNIEP